MFLAIERFLRKIGNQPNYQLPTNYGIGLMGPGNYCRTSKKTAWSIWTRVAPHAPYIRKYWYLVIHPLLITPSMIPIISSSQCNAPKPQTDSTLKKTKDRQKYVGFCSGTPMGRICKSKNLKSTRLESYTTSKFLLLITSISNFMGGPPTFYGGASEILQGGPLSILGWRARAQA